MKSTTFRYIRAFLLDLFLWTYTALVSYKILYERFILQLRRPEFEWNQVLLSGVAGAMLALAFFFIKGFSVGKHAQGLSRAHHEDPFYKKPHALFLVWNVVITFMAGLIISKVSFSEFFSAGGLKGAQNIFQQLLSPNFEIFEPSLFAAIETIYMAFMATVFAIPFAFVVSFFAAKNLMNANFFLKLIYALARFILNVTRSIEPLVWAIIFSVWVGIGPFAGMLALFLHSVASLAKLYSEQIENVADGPIEAMKATGAAPVLVVWYGVVPQIIIPFLSFTIYRWDINVRMATIIGMVGGGGIGTMLIQYQGQAMWKEVGLIVMVIAAIVWILDYASAKIREAIK
jgi:phosphonate transport system permease protein